MLPSRILVIDDEVSVTDALRLVLIDLGHHVDAAKSGTEAKELLKGSPYDLVFTDLRLPDASGIDLLTLIKSDTPNTEVIVMTAHGSLEIAIEAIKHGAFYYIEKPFTPDQVETLVERALQFEAIKRENRSLKSVGSLQHKMASYAAVGRCPANALGAGANRSSTVFRGPPSAGDCARGDSSSSNHRIRGIRWQRGSRSALHDRR